MSDATDGGYRAAAEPSPRVEKIRLLARMRVVDSILIPGVLMVLAVGSAWFVFRAQLPPVGQLFFFVFVAGTVGVLGVVWWRLARPCVLEIAWPHRTLRWSLPGEERRAHAIDIESIARVITYGAEHNDSVVFLVAFERKDGARVPLFDDTNFGWGEEHAEAIAERVRRFVREAPAGTDHPAG